MHNGGASMIIGRCVRTLPHFRFFRKRSRSPSSNPASTRSCEPSHPPASRIEAITVLSALRSRSRTFTSVFKPVRTSATVHADVPLRFQCTSFNGRQTLSNGREEALYFFPQVRDRLAIARKMPQQASLEESIKQRIEGPPGDNRLSAAK